jgi:hypothetical protein
MSPKKTDAKPSKRLGVAFIGSGFNARFHLQAFRAVRDADVLGIWSPHKKNAASAAQLARDLTSAMQRPYRRRRHGRRSGDRRDLAHRTESCARRERPGVVDAIERGKGTLAGTPVKPLARNVAEAIGCAIS